MNGDKPIGFRSSRELRHRNGCPEGAGERDTATNAISNNFDKSLLELVKKRALTCTVHPSPSSEVMDAIEHGVYGCHQETREEGSDGSKDLDDRIPSSQLVRLVVA